ncbi:hypothetical protein ACWJJH_02325 [Endozoicomonadaceae bacterium StTr2]
MLVVPGLNSPSVMASDEPALLAEMEEIIRFVGSEANLKTPANERVKRFFELSARLVEFRGGDEYAARTGLALLAGHLQMKQVYIPDVKGMARLLGERGVETRGEIMPWPQFGDLGDPHLTDIISKELGFGSIIWQKSEDEDYQFLFDALKLAVESPQTVLVSYPGADEVHMSALHFKTVGTELRVFFVDSSSTGREMWRHPFIGAIGVSSLVRTNLFRMLKRYYSMQAESGRTVPWSQINLYQLGFPAQSLEIDYDCVAYVYAWLQFIQQHSAEIAFDTDKALSLTSYRPDSMENGHYTESGEAVAGKLKDKSIFSRFIPIDVTTVSKYSTLSSVRFFSDEYNPVIVAPEVRLDEWMITSLHPRLAALVENPDALKVWKVNHDTLPKASPELLAKDLTYMMTHHEVVQGLWQPFLSDSQKLFNLAPLRLLMELTYTLLSSSEQASAQ